MKRLIIIYIAIVALVWAGCEKQRPTDPLKPTDASTHYANLLQMQDVEEGVTICRIFNPWRPEKVVIQYLLVDEKATGLRGGMSEEEQNEAYAEYEGQFGAFQVLEVPMQSQTLTSSCHLWLLEQLGALASVGVVCDANYVMLPAVQHALEENCMLDGGSSMAPNAEVIKAAQSPCIWVSPFEATSQQIVTAQLPDVAIIYCADYMESTPLGRAEWMRFYGRLVGKVREADSLFHIVEMNYNEEANANLVKAEANARCMILPDLPYGATWYVPGGRSTLGIMYGDAGFGYAWSEDIHGGSLSLSPEAVFAKAHDADIWIFKHYDAERPVLDLQWLLSQNAMYKQFKAAQKGQVYCCNTAYSDYFDATPFRPDVLLSELIHLRKGETDSLIYFRRLQ